jgi:hypothetical protein
MTIIALMILSFFFGPDPQPGLPSHQLARENLALATVLQDQCSTLAWEHYHTGDFDSWGVCWAAYWDQNGRCQIWALIVDATDPELTWLLRGQAYHDLVERIGQRAVFSGELVRPWGDWVPVVK